MDDKSKFIVLPHFSFKTKKVIFLEKCIYLHLKETINLNSLKHLALLLEKGVIIKKYDIPISSSRTALVIEPHPDDFALSCLGIVLNRKMDCHVSNIFLKTSMRNCVWKNLLTSENGQYAKLRLIESNFCINKFLGYTFDSLNLKTVRFIHTNSKKYHETTEIITTKLLDKLKEYNYNYLFFPMSVGKHPDHVILLDILIKNYKTISKHVRNIILYEEYPYSSNKPDTDDAHQKIIRRFKTKDILVNVNNELDTISSAISVYKSQFEDIDMTKSLDIYKEFLSSRNVRYNKQGKNNYFQRYIKIIGEK